MITMNASNCWILRPLSLECIVAVDDVGFEIDFLLDAVRLVQCLVILCLCVERRTSWISPLLYAHKLLIETFQWHNNKMVTTVVTTLSRSLCFWQLIYAIVIFVSIFVFGLFV